MIKLTFYYSVDWHNMFLDTQKEEIFIKTSILRADNESTTNQSTMLSRCLLLAASFLSDTVFCMLYVMFGYLLLIRASFDAGNEKINNSMH